MTPTARIRTVATRKVGPAPLWVWALMLLAAFLLYRQFGGRVEGAAAGGYVPAASRTAPATSGESAAGGGSAGLPEMPSDLLEQAFAKQVQQIDSLTVALTGTSADAASPAGAPQGAFAQAGPASDAIVADWPQLVAAGQTNEQLPTNLQLEGVAPDAPVISSYFDQPTTIQGPNSVPVIEAVKPPPQIGYGAPDPWQYAAGVATPDYERIYSSSAMLPPTQTQPAPQVQPALDLYTSDNLMLGEQRVSGAGRHIAA